MPSRMDGSSDALLGTLNVSRGCDRPGRDAAIKALALIMPGPAVQEVLVKSTLLTLNDAVATDKLRGIPREIVKAVPRSDFRPRS